MSLPTFLRSGSDGLLVKAIDDLNTKVDNMPGGESDWQGIQTVDVITGNEARPAASLVLWQCSGATTPANAAATDLIVPK